jgi:hypothetical protein
MVSPINLKLLKSTVLNLESRPLKSLAGHMPPRCFHSSEGILKDRISVFLLKSRYTNISRQFMARHCSFPTCQRWMLARRCSRFGLHQKIFPYYQTRSMQGPFPMTLRITSTHSLVVSQWRIAHVLIAKDFATCRETLKTNW